uniref:Uncharacterized protein n=1 Tax=Alexandrium monilatum TaxID=311494 RepID=A0A7S4V3A4_9DINO
MACSALAAVLLFVLAPGTAFGARIKEDAASLAALGGTGAAHRARSSVRLGDLAESFEDWRAALKERTTGQCLYPGNVMETSQGCRTMACVCKNSPLFECYEPPLRYGIALAGTCALADWAYFFILMLLLACCTPPCCYCCCRRK